MDKITDLKEKLAEQYRKQYGKDYGPASQIKSAYSNGFSAAMELQLPVLFITWAFSESEYQWTGESWDENTGHDDFESLTHKELYDHWITNIYQPEK